MIDLGTDDVGLEGRDPISHLRWKDRMVIMVIHIWMISDHHALNSHVSVFIRRPVKEVKVVSARSVYLLLRIQLGS